MSHSDCFEDTRDVDYLKRSSTVSEVNIRNLSTKIFPAISDTSQQLALEGNIQTIIKFEQIDKIWFSNRDKDLFIFQTIKGMTILSAIDKTAIESSKFMQISFFDLQFCNVLFFWHKDFLGGSTCLFETYNQLIGEV